MLEEHELEVGVVEHLLNAFVFPLLQQQKGNIVEKPGLKMLKRRGQQSTMVSKLVSRPSNPGFDSQRFFVNVAEVASLHRGKLTVA